MTHFKPMTRLDAVVICVGILAALVYFVAPVLGEALQDSLFKVTGSVLALVILYFVVGRWLFSKQ